MKLLLLLLVGSFLTCDLSSGDISLKKIRVRNCENHHWKNRHFKTEKAEFTAALDIKVPPQAREKNNRIRIEITPIKGTFIKRNMLLALHSSSSRFPLRPLEAEAGVKLRPGKKNVLEYLIPPEVPEINLLRLYFNRKVNDTSPHEFRLHRVKFYYAFSPRTKKEFQYKVCSDKCILIADHDRGLTPREACYIPFGKRLAARPTPIAKLPWIEPAVTGSGTEYGKIPVFLEEEAQVSRRALLRFGVPFSQKTVYSVKNLRFCAPGGRTIPAQFSALSRHADGSIKDLFVTAFSDLKAGEKRTCFLEYGRKIQSSPLKDPLKYTFSKDELFIDTGRLQARIRKNGFNLTDDLRVDGKAAGAFLPTEIQLVNGKKLTLADPEKFELLEAGPLCLTLRVQGKYTGNAGSYVIRFSFQRGRAGFDLEFTHINSVLDMEFTDFKTLVLNFRPQGKNLRPFSVFQKNDRILFKDDLQETEGKSDGSFKISANTGLAVADFWQRYPKAVSLKNDILRIALLPELPSGNFNQELPWKLKYLYANGGYRLKWGTSFTERMTFDFSGASTRQLAAERNLPVIAVLPAAWYRQCKIIPQEDTSLVDAAVTVAFNRYIQRQHKEREFGFLNYGDSFGERGHSWTNNEYDPAQSMAECFLRTGNRAMLRYAQSTARHQADVDTCHAYPNDYFIGANLQHSVGHSGIERSWSGAYTRYSAASGGHSWTRGRLLVWQLTGDFPVMDSALLFGDHAALAVIPHYKTIIGLAPREIGWMLRALVPLYQITRDPIYLSAMKQAASLAVKECAYEHGAWPRQIHRIHKGYKITDKGNVTYQAALMLKGLCDYYHFSGDKQVKKVIETTSKWIIKAFNPGESAGFHYDLAADGKVLNWPYNGLNALIAPPLAEAAVIINSPEIFAVARKSMAKVLLTEYPIDHKHFAIGLGFLADYLKAASQWNSRNRLKSDYTPSALYKVLFEGTKQTFRIRGNSRWEIISQKADASLTLLRWIRNGKPVTPVRVVLRSKHGKVLSQKSLPPEILQQQLSLPLPGPAGSRFTLEITDSFSADWSIAPASNVVSAAFMQPEGLAIAHIGLKRFYIHVPAGKAPVIRYAGSHIGLWQIKVRDQKREFIKTGFAQDNSVKKFQPDAAVIPLKSSPLDRRVEIICQAASDGRIFVSEIDKIFVEKGYKP